jgi:hypothetical protein
MSPAKFFLNYDCYADKTIAEFDEEIENIKLTTKYLRDVTISELCSMPNHPNGIYLIFGGNLNETKYIGKCTSRSFIERIPSHFDQREDSWFGTLPKRVRQEGQSYQEAIEECMSFKIILLGIQDKNITERIERILIHSYQPTLNRLKHLQVFDRNTTLREHVRVLGWIPSVI